MNTWEYQHSLIIQRIRDALEDRPKDNHVIIDCLEEIYKPLVQRINEDCDERISLYQREIELLKEELIKARLTRVYVGEVTVEGKRVQLWTTPNEV